MDSFAMFTLNARMVQEFMVGRGCETEPRWNRKSAAKQSRKSCGLSSDHGRVETCLQWKNARGSHIWRILPREPGGGKGR